MPLQKNLSANFESAGAMNSLKALAYTIRNAKSSRVQYYCKISQFFFEADQIAYRHSGTPEFKYLPKLPELTTVE